MEGPSSDLAVLLTREVRWFKTGQLPAAVVQWFTADGELGEPEHRIDRYDPASAANGVGVKLRNTETLDAKFRLAYKPDLPLAPGLSGDVEDWMKVSQPQPEDRAAREKMMVRIGKDLITRTYHFEPSTNGTITIPSGCDVELASVRLNGTKAWSLCLEAFGPPAGLEHAFRSAVAMFLDETPLPDDLTFGSEESCSYPDWIARDHVITSA